MTHEKIWMFIYIGVLILTINSGRFRSIFLFVCRESVRNIREMVRFSQIKLKVLPKSVFVGILLINLIYLLYLMILYQDLLNIKKNIMITILLALLFIGVFFQRKRISFVLIIIPLLLFATNFISNHHFLLSEFNLILIILSVLVIAWLGLSSFNQLLLRYWSVYDMCILFGAILFLSWKLSIVTAVFVIQFLSIYILSKVVFSQLERADTK